MGILRPPVSLDAALPVRAAGRERPLEARAPINALLRAAHLAQHLEAAGLTHPVDARDLPFAVACGLAPSPSDVVAPEAQTALFTALARGVSLETLLHHAHGTAEDPAHARNAPGTLADRRLNLLTPGAAPAAHLCHAVGVAWAMRLQGRAAAALASFGSEAIPEPDLHAALNFAAVFHAPVVLAARSSRARTRSPSAPGLAARALTYGIAAERVDASDVEALVGALSEALERARRGGGPALVEAVDQPEPDDRPTVTETDEPRRESYRAAASWAARRAGLSEADLGAAWKAALAEHEGALAELERAHPPAGSTLFGDVLAE